LHVAWDDRLAGYDFGSGHPMAPARVEMTIELARTFGLFSAAGVSVEPPASADEWQLEMVHVQPYIAAVRQTGDPAPDPSLLDFGLGTEDNPVFPGMHDASALVVGATVAAALKVWAGVAWHGASIAGGLHHAMRASASGFCVYNDPAIAISWHGAIHQLAHEVAGGRWLLTGGGGYELLQVVPRTWTHLLAEAAGYPIDPQARIPAAWREYASRRTGREPPETMTDGTEPEFTRFESGYDPGDPIDKAILATREAVFPEHGLMPEF
jgi:acetoin utilization deacetylase AcuC-like enzyme